MQKKDLRTRVTTGTYTLPAMTALTAVLWVAPDAGSWRLWAGLVTAAWTAFQLIELNNRCTLLRVRSRMVSVTFLGLLLVLPAAHGFTPQSLVPLCVAASFRPLFGAYQKAEAQHHVFQAFLLVSLGSLLFPPLLLLLPCYCLSLAVHLRALTGRTLAAGVLGAALPYWLGAAWAMWRGDLGARAAEWAAAFRFAPPGDGGLGEALAALGPARQAAGAFMLALALMATVHFLRTAYNDKIRTRMFFYTFIVSEVAVAAGLVVRPQDFDTLAPVLAVCAAPLAGHYFTLARGRGMNVWFVLWCLLCAALCAFTYACTWMPSLIS